MATKTENYAIIAVGGKQYVVREGERLVVDRVGAEEGKTFNPGVLFVGGDGKGQLAPSTSVTARVIGHVRGDKVRIGKRRPKSGYRRQTGFRAALTQIEIESIGSGSKAAAKPKQAEPKHAEESSQETVAKETAVQPPRGYAEFTVAEIGEKAKRWKLEQLEAALEFERANTNRKGAISALESAIETRQENS
jgi:large subunit ribosomal protein L21